MKKRFVVLLQNSTKEQDESFLAFIKQSGDIGWWHWFDGSWLLYTPNVQYTTKQLSDKLMEIYPGVHHMVLEENGANNSWHGFGIKGGERDMFKWMHENW